MCNMENVENVLDNFLSDDNQKKDAKNKKKEVIGDKVIRDNSIIERIDKVIISEDGRQLLREQY